MRKLVDNPRGICLVHPAINTITLTVGFKACSLSGPVPHLSFFDSAHAQQLIKKKTVGPCARDLVTFGTCRHVILYTWTNIDN